MITELAHIIISTTLAEIARCGNIQFRIKFREKVFQLHHNLIGLGFIITSFLLSNMDIFFFGSGLMLHHLMTEGW